ncbi:hypothetical protein A2U01_0118164, partial [Trifolium medium]|nr:hypothetical protein [Trifolium medium]
ADMHCEQSSLYRGQTATAICLKTGSARKD